jgi:hypothetical protein
MDSAQEIREARRSHECERGTQECVRHSYKNRHSYSYRNRHSHSYKDSYSDRHKHL